MLFFFRHINTVSIDFQIPASQQMIQFKDDFGGKETLKSGLTGANFG